MTTATIISGNRVEWLVVGVVLTVPLLFALALPRFIDVSADRWTGVALIAAVTVMEVPLAALAVWATGWRGETLASIGVTRPHPLSIAIGVAVLAGALWLIWARHTGVWDGASSAAGAGGGAYTTAQRLAFVALGVPQIYLQELLYRGFAITFLERWTHSVAAAIALASAAFTLAHITSLGGNLLVSLASVFLVSVLLSLLYIATRTLAPVFLVHWAWVIWLTVALSDTASTSAAAAASPVG